MIHDHSELNLKAVYCYIPSAGISDFLFFPVLLSWHGRALVLLEHFSFVCWVFSLSLSLYSLLFLQGQYVIILMGYCHNQLSGILSYLPNYINISVCWVLVVLSCYSHPYAFTFIMKPSLRHGDGFLRFILCICDLNCIPTIWFTLLHLSSTRFYPPPLHFISPTNWIRMTLYLTFVAKRAAIRITF